MVKVTIENDRCKNEITGEFFMGLMITEEEPSIWMMRSVRRLRRMRVRLQMK